MNMQLIIFHERIINNTVSIYKNEIYMITREGWVTHLARMLSFHVICDNRVKEELKAKPF